MFWDDERDGEIPEYGYTVGDYSPAGRGEAQMAMRNDRDAAMARMRNANVHPDIKTGWLLNTQGQWDNAMQTAAASQWFNGYFRPGRDTVAKPFIMQGGTVDGGYEDDTPAFRPGLTGAVQGKPMYRPYNNGDFSTQKGGRIMGNARPNGWINDTRSAYVPQLPSTDNDMQITNLSGPGGDVVPSPHFGPQGGKGFGGFGGGLGSGGEEQTIFDQARMQQRRQKAFGNSMNFINKDRAKFMRQNPNAGYDPYRGAEDMERQKFFSPNWRG